LALVAGWLIVLGKRAAIRPGSETENPRMPVPVDIVEAPPKWDSTRNRMVQTEASDSTTKPKSDAFLGAKNQTVDRETVSRKQMVTSGQARATPAQPVRPQPQQQQQPASSGAPKSSTKSVLSHLGVPIFKIPSTPKEALKAEARARAPQWASAGAGREVPSDYIKGMNEGDRTALNTREYMFFGYFQRIRNRLDIAWSATLRDKLEKMYRKGRRIASDKEFKTRTWVVLDDKGSVVNVRLMEESGVYDLDDAAIAAFNEAGPFPTPPKGLINERGQVEVNWDFVLRN